MLQHIFGIFLWEPVVLVALQPTWKRKTPAGGMAEGQSAAKKSTSSSSLLPLGASPPTSGEGILMMLKWNLKHFLGDFYFL
ncbi:hypothetical protein Y1Q_0010692 [Alligator mississippiensis]|uniref:Uncharacterized protein n=1 Tax=Alligator mississippiensis TaxID=8496 RepID=A0A151M6F3_ALLMI|nr:hypothetical protein Y1Q_0010692 [Alligator mississippiensis]